MDPLEIAIAIKVLGELTESPAPERYGIGAGQREELEGVLELLKGLNAAMGAMPMPVPGLG